MALHVINNESSPPCADRDDDDVHDVHFVLRLMPFSYLFMQPLYYFTAGSKLNSNDLLSGPD